MLLMRICVGFSLSLYSDLLGALAVFPAGMMEVWLESVKKADYFRF